MMRSKPFTLSALSIAMAAGLYACGGGGGGSDASPAADSGGNTSGVTLSGIVSAPSVTAVALNKGLGDKLLDFFLSPAFAELTGLTALSGATVEIIELNSDGTEKNAGTPLFTTLTDAAGEYSFDDPAIVPGSRYLIKVKKGSLTIRAPLYASEVNVDPVTDAVVTKVLADVAAGTATTIDNFTPSELSALVTIVASNTNLDATDTDLDTLVSTITTDTGLDTMTTDMVMTDAGDTSATSAFGGDYNFIFKQGGFDIKTTTSVIATNTAGANNSATMNAGLATYSETSDQHGLIVSKAGPSVTTSNLASSTETGSAPYYETATHQLYIADVIGATTPDGLQFAFPTAWSDTYSTEHGIHFGGKKLTAAPNLSGKSFHLIGLQHYMENDAGTNAFFEAESYSGSISFTGASTASYDLSSNRLQMQLNDTIAEDLLGPDVLADLSYTVGNTGVLSISSPTHGGEFLKGFISGNPDGNYVGGIIADGGTHAAHNGIVIIEAATATPSLSGSYNVFESCTDISDPDLANPYNANFTLETSRGVMTFDGAGIGSVTSTTQSSTFNPGGYFGNMSITTQPTSSFSNPSFAYTLATDGTLSFGTATGAVSANGNVFAFTDADVGYRCIVIGLKQ